nr:right-handed parallel beta-helix repeat-containing protein [uncultured Actinoplanes sp.]
MRSRTWLILLVVLVLTAGGAGVWRGLIHASRPPDVGDAGPGFWVSTRGDDRAGGTADAPWRTIRHAVASATAGSRIFVRAGDYEPFTVNRPNLTITSAPGERATIVGRSGTRDVVLIAANSVTVTDLTVRGCVPEPDPDVGVTGDHGSGIRVHRVSKILISGVTVRDSAGRNAANLPVGCHGILITESRDVHVTGSQVYHNGAGIGVTRGGRGVLVDHNDVHDQNVIIQNSAARNDDFGGYGLSATFVSDSPGPVFRANTVRRNYGPSSDYGVDGGGMELYDANNVTVAANTFEGNDGVMETGTSGASPCAGSVFSGNRAIGGTVAGHDRDTGLVLRCATGMAITGNTFSTLSRFTFLLQTGGDFGGRIDDLAITGNTITRKTGTVVYRLQYASAPPSGLRIDRNTYRNGAAGFAVLDGLRSETTVPFAGWRARTGFDAGSRAG